MNLYRSLAVNLLYVAVNAISAMVFRTHWFVLFAVYYAHYDVITALAKAFTEKTEKMIQSLPHSENDYSWIFTCIKERPHHFMAYFKLGIREVEADDKTLFLRSAVHGVAKLWLENGCTESAEHMGALIKRELKR